MASPETLTFESLLAPIAGDNPTGKELRRGDAAYDQVKDAADRARSAEKRLYYGGGVDEQGEKIAPPDWGPILKAAPKALVENSKDLRIVAALIEALVRIKGFAGLRDGFRLARELVEKYWVNLHPMPDEDGIATRVAPLMHLNGQEGKGILPDAILRVPITERKSFGAFSTADYGDAAALQAIADPDKRTRREEEGVPTLEKFLRSAKESSPKFFADLLEDLTQCREEFALLGKCLDELCGKDENKHLLSPPTAAIREALESCFDTAKKISKDVLEPALGNALEVDSPVAATVNGTSSSATVLAGGVVRNREEAFSALLRVADYFKKTEPHSPVSYALEQAVRWGRMSLPDLLVELVPEEVMREQMFRRVGILKETQNNS